MPLAIRTIERIHLSRATMRVATFAFLLCGFWLVGLETAAARVTRVEVTSRADFASGKSFGLAGPYEKVAGKIYFAVDPNNLHDKTIVDIDLAPRNAKGLVEFSADFYVIKPKDQSRGNGAALFEVSNRGGKALLSVFNHARRGYADSIDPEAGDGFLMRYGFTLVWIGWEFDVPASNGALRVYAPYATDHGAEITGTVRSDLVFNSRVFFSTLGHRGMNAQPAIGPDDPSYTMTVRDTVLGERRPVPRSDWQFARVVDGKPVADPTFVYLKSGFEPGKIYEVVYRTHNPTIVGLGLAAVRDAASYFKYDPTALAPVARAYGYGISQSGRFLRHFLYQGFNADENGRMVFDGMNAQVAGGGKGSFNHRFAEPSRDASEFSTFFYPTDIFPFTDVAQTDPETGVTDGLLTHAQQPLPKIFYTFTSYEYWGRAVSLIHTAIDGKSDAPMMDNVRIYYFAGGQHVANQFPPARHETQNLVSPNDYTWCVRALLIALDRWVKGEAPPPVSRYPQIADHSLVSPKEVNFPKIPGVAFPERIHEAYRVDYGPDWSRGRITVEPPRIGKAFPMMVPQVDADGIDMGGVRLPEVAVPLGTYTGWNMRDPEIGAPKELVDFAGSFIPFAATRAGREKIGDPRPSLSERYSSRDQYLGLIAQSAANLVHEGFLLPEDVTAIIGRAETQWDWVHSLH